MPVTERVDALRERLLAPELREARELLVAGGFRALVDDARRLVGEADSERRRFETFSSDFAASPPQERTSLVERHLRATAVDARKLAGDLRALRKSRPGDFDVGAFSDRAALRADALERRAEAHLAIARIQTLGAGDLAARDVLALARARGRWSRRSEALALFAKLAQFPLSDDSRADASESLRRLASPDEHRWVQPAALAAWAVTDNAAAHTFAMERLTSERDGDDFLVRSRIVTLAARFRHDGWMDLIPIAEADSSELVRMSAVRVNRRRLALERIAVHDASHRVRALSLIVLAKRFTRDAFDALARAAREDPHAFVVNTAVEEIVSVTKKCGAGEPQAVRDALFCAASRVDLASTVRAAGADALVEFDVLTTEARSVYAALAPLVREIPVGGVRHVSSAAVATADPQTLAKILAVLARDDFGLSVDRTSRGIVLYRGERRGFAPWRLLFELMHPRPSKRQAFDHTRARRPRGSLRAPPGGMAEVTATGLPGERVLVDASGGWGRHLPLLDDLLSVTLAKKVSLVSSYGITTLTPPATRIGRARAWLALTVRYAHFADLRHCALSSVEPRVQMAYVNEVARLTGVTIDIAPFVFDVGHPRALAPPAQLATGVQTAAASGAVTQALALAILPFHAVASQEPFAMASEWWRELADYAGSPGGSSISQLAVYGIALLGAMAFRGVAIRDATDRDRRSIPLVIGGWGTRGKSGTERLKAAMFHGLGYESLVKTTGCEAMFIHAIPGVPAHEVFIYRPYDKASVWEQRQVLGLARRFGVRVFLWECMALQSDLVNLLQSQWMHDDYSTITNAYPDHEDVQGPSGLDVATAIAEFVPHRGQLFTAEEQMLPVLRERARERDTAIQAVRPRDAELIPSDLLARFGHAEHPRNVALVVALARRLGVPATVAIAEMADNVVPDLGVLKTYPVVVVRGRFVAFTNGMGANDRTGTLGNWHRMGFDAHDPDADPARWIVTVVNNRADRVARSDVFARLIVQDISAHRHVLIGTNVVGLVASIGEALDRHIEAALPTRGLAGVEGRQTIALTRIDKAFAQLKVCRTDAASVLAELSALGVSPVDDVLVTELLVALDPGESYEMAVRTVRARLVGFADPPCLPFVVAMIARRRTVHALKRMTEQCLDSRPDAVDRAFRSAYRAMFAESVVPLVDPALTGDAIIDAVASHVPPGARASVMGIQNIKGTGLDFVYRWVSIDAVRSAIEGLRGADRGSRARALMRLMVHDDYGTIDSTMALEAVETARDADAEAALLPYEAVASRLRDIVAARTREASTRHRPRLVERWRNLVGETLDFLDAIRRRNMSARVLDDLLKGRISHGTAATRMRAIVARAHGAWMAAPHRARPADPEG